MAFSGGTFSRLYDWTTDRDNGVKILASRMDQEFDGMATGLSTCILKDGTQTCTAAIPFAQGITLPDNKTIILGTNSDITIQYDESTNDSLEIAANVEGAALGIVLKADQGDDNADQHKVGIADGGTLTMASKISGSFVSYLTHTPNSTVASSTTAVAGNLTVGGDLTLGSGAVISEAELEKLDGITNGTVAANKAVVVDGNKDIASFRNVTLTGELDAGSLDVSGNADIDGTLEADAITVNGTALNTVIAGVTVTDATNSAHVLVTDNESTNEENLITFVEDATASTGNVGLEMDGNLTYNPSTGTITSTIFKGNIDAVDGDFDGTLEADAITLNGTAITATATLDTGISNNNVPKFTSGVADDDFLRVAGTAIEGRSAAEVLSDIAAAPAAGSSNIVTTGALNSGSITSGFGAIDNGSSNITTTGVGTFASLDISGDIDVDGTTNLDVVDIDGAVDMASTLQVDGAITSSAAIVSQTGGSNSAPAIAITSGSLGVNGITAPAANTLGFVTGTGERLRITAAGLVGISTSSPEAKIDIVGNSDSVAAIKIGPNASFGHHIYDSATNGDLVIKREVSGTQTETMRLTRSGGNLLVGRTSSLFGTEKLHVYNTTNVASFWCDTGSDLGAFFIRHERASGGTTAEMVAFKASGGGTVGSIRSSGSSTSYNTSSDYRLKENVTADWDATTRLKQLNPVRFNFIADADTTVDGFLAHEVQSVIPEAITGTKDAMRDEEYTVSAATGDIYTPAVEATYDEDGVELTAAVDEVIHSADVERPEELAEGQLWRETTVAVMGTRSVPDYQGIDQSKLTPLLTKALIEAVEKIEQLEARIAALEAN